MVEHSSVNPKVPSSILGPVSYRGHGCGYIGFLSPMHKKIPDSYLKREGGNPGNSGLSSQQYMVAHYPRTM